MLSDYECDNYDDCGDNSDEQGCGIVIIFCESDEFTCDNGDCVPSDYECDDFDDCGDNSDEQGCGIVIFYN